MSKLIIEKTPGSWFVFFSLLIAIFICYFPSFNNGFTNWDDQEYVLKNEAIHTLTFQSICNLFTRILVISYHPLTLLSLQINYYLSGESAFGYIFTNVLFHFANSLLVYKMVRELNFDARLSFFMALLFAIHPVQVESVAWIAERKDVLYAFFFLLSVIFYVRYSKTGKNKLYIFSLLLFIFSCLSKAQAISLSLVLFLVDYTINRNHTSVKFLNKIPFLVISILFGIISVVAQGTNVNAFTGNDFSLVQRLALASHSYLFYIGHVLFPYSLSAFYPYPDSFQSAYFLFIPLAIFILLFAIYQFRKNSLVIFSILFFTTTIFFLLQIFPIGDAMMADRYTYVPSIGLFIIMVLIIDKLSKKYKNLKLPLTIISLIYFVFLAQSTFARCYIWKDGITLWSDVIKKYPNTSIAYTNRGANYYDRGNSVAALADFTKAVEIDSMNSFARYNAGLIYYNENDYSNCLKMLNGIELINESNSEIFLMRAFSENKLQDYTSSDRNIKNFLSYRKTAEAFTLAGLNKIQSGDYANAKLFLDSAINTDTTYWDAFVKRGVLFIQTGDTAAACSDWKKAAAAGKEEVRPFVKQYCD